MSRGNFPPEGNEGEPTWWERNRNELLDLNITLAKLLERETQKHSVNSEFSRRISDPKLAGHVGERLAHIRNLVNLLVTEVRKTDPDFSEETEVSFRKLMAPLRVLRGRLSHFAYWSIPDFIADEYAGAAMQDSARFENLKDALQRDLDFLDYLREVQDMDQLDEYAEIDIKAFVSTKLADEL